MFSALLIILSLSLAETENIQLRLPVRVMGEDVTFLELDKDDLQLFVNGKQRNILEIRKKTKSLGSKPYLGRDFILSFHLTDYGKHVESGISYLVTELLDTTDSLYIVSPLNVYQMTVTPNKSHLIDSIQELLRKDCEEFRKQRLSYEQKMLSSFNSLKMVLTGDSYADNQSLSQRQYKQIVQFLNSFPAQFSAYKDIYFLPHVDHYQQVLDSIEIGDTERWWIHFQQKEEIAIFPKLTDSIKRIKAFMSRDSQAHSQTLQSSISYLEKDVRFAESFPKELLQKTMLGNHVNYNVILFRSYDRKDTEHEYEAFSSIEESQRKITQACGGKTVDSPDSKLGIREIEKHTDCYFEIAYDWNGKIDNKQIKLQGEHEEMSLSYMDNMPSERVSSLIDFLSKERIQIRDINISGNLLTFYIEAFAHEQAEAYGLFKVKVELLDRMDQVVYNSENTLRASKDSICIRLPFARKYRGQYTLALSAYDLIAKRFVSVDRKISLN